MPPFFGPSEFNLNPEYRRFYEGTPDAAPNPGGYYGTPGATAAEGGPWGGNYTTGWFSNLPGGGDPYALVEASRAKAAELGQKMIMRPGLDVSREPPNVPGPSPWPGGSVSASVMPRSYSGGTSSYSVRPPTATGYRGYSVQAPQYTFPGRGNPDPNEVRIPEYGDGQFPVRPPGVPGYPGERPGQPLPVPPQRPQYPGGPIGVAPGASGPPGAQGFDRAPVEVAEVQDRTTRYVTDSNERIQQLVLAQKAAENAGNWALAREIETMRVGVQNRQIDVNEALGQAQLLLNRELGMGALDMQRLGITTAADTAKLGYASNENIAGMQNATARAGMATNASLTREGYGLQRDLGMAGIGVQREGIQSGERVGMAGVGVQREGIQSGERVAVRGQDVQERLGNRGYDVTLELGRGGLANQRYSTEVERELGLGGLSNQRLGIDSGERVAFGGYDRDAYQTDSGERIANRGFQSQDLASAAALSQSDDLLAYDRFVRGMPIDTSTSPWALGGTPAPSWQRAYNTNGYVDSTRGVPPSNGAQATGTFGQAAQGVASPAAAATGNVYRGPTGQVMPGFAQETVRGENARVGMYPALQTSAQQRNALAASGTLGAWNKLRERGGVNPGRADSAEGFQAEAFAGRAPTRTRSWGR